MDWYHVLLLLGLLAHAIGSALIYTRVLRLLADISITSATITGAADDTAAREVEITPEMLEAGIAALASYNPKFVLEEDGVRRIYIAMTKAKHLAESVAAGVDSRELAE
jgi:hypothetical protein